MNRKKELATCMAPVHANDHVHQFFRSVEGRFGKWWSLVSDNNDNSSKLYRTRGHTEPEQLKAPFYVGRGTGSPFYTVIADWVS